MYLAQRHADERFIDTFRRIGVEPFRRRSMPKPLIKDRQIIDDAWTLVRDAEAGAPAGLAILPLALWKTLRDSRAAADTGVWLARLTTRPELAGAVANCR